MRGSDAAATSTADVLGSLPATLSQGMEGHLQRLCPNPHPAPILQAPACTYSGGKQAVDGGPEQRSPHSSLQMKRFIFTSREGVLLARVLFFLQSQHK